MSKHTPVTSAGDLEKGTIMVGNYVVYRLLPTGPESPYSSEVKDQMLVDATLFAAAPDLLAACEAARNMVRPIDDENDQVGARVLNMLEAAIAKATGGAK